MHIAWVTVSGWSRPTHQKTIQSQRFSPQHCLSCRRRCEKCSRNGTRRTSRADVGPTGRGTSRPTRQNQYKVIVFLLVNIDFLLVDAAKCVAGVGRGAHRARTSGQPQAGPRVLPDKNPTKSMCVLPTLTFFLSTLRNAKEEWDAAHIAGGRLGNH